MTSSITHAQESFLRGGEWTGLDFWIGINVVDWRPPWRPITSQAEKHKTGLCASGTTELNTVNSKIVCYSLSVSVNDSSKKRSGEGRGLPSSPFLSGPDPAPRWSHWLPARSFDRPHWLIRELGYFNSNHWFAAVIFRLLLSCSSNSVICNRQLFRTDFCFPWSKIDPVYFKLHY